MCSVRAVHVAFLDVMTLAVTKLVLVTFFQTAVFPTSVHRLRVFLGTGLFRD
jgi:hypothetical protein